MFSPSTTTERGLDLKTIAMFVQSSTVEYEFSLLLFSAASQFPGCPVQGYWLYKMLLNI
jgi:hypothetical protein